LIATFPALNINIDDYTLVKDYLLSFGKKRLEQSGKKGSRKETNNKWFEVQDTIAYYKEFEKEKIVWASVGETYFTFVKRNRLLLDTNYFCVFDIQEINKYVLAIINTKLLVYFLNSKDTKVGTIAYRHYKYNFEQLPIPKIPTKSQTPFITLTDTILAKKEKGEDTTAEENKTDIMVYKLYDLTYDEVKIIDPEIEKIISKEKYNAKSIGEIAG